MWLRVGAGELLGSDDGVGGGFRRGGHLLADLQQESGGSQGGCESPKWRLHAWLCLEGKWANLERTQDSGASREGMGNSLGFKVTQLLKSGI